MRCGGWIAPHRTAPRLPVATVPAARVAPAAERGRWEEEEEEEEVRCNRARPLGQPLLAARPAPAVGARLRGGGCAAPPGEPRLPARGREGAGGKAVLTAAPRLQKHSGLQGACDDE
ncbi:hypothetical protein DV515_00010942 [Chloebia gouldiae]|uniref:Uncharacterized protein n=1 Tax=Chloebia gouldiae TaxID=44316 RepID=A0A3L8S7R9_CHLGU|nr:hypothetical protein DV515_00010942 [Chloebia gouldiae]